MTPCAGDATQDSHHQLEPRQLSTWFLREELGRVAPGRGSAITLGVFDGVHRGHRHLVDVVMARARSRALASGVVTFHPHPRIVLRHHAGPIYLTSLEERLELLRGMGVDFVAPVTFTSTLALTSARDFCLTLREVLDLRCMVVGPGFALGRDREGRADLLSTLGAEMGFEVEVMAPLLEGDEVVRSSAVRGAIQAGNVRRAALLLGRPLSLTGPVVRGDSRGRSIGFPTANIAIGEDRLLPEYGVYATRVFVGEAIFPSATNIGERPTFGVNRRTVETHIIGFDGDLYGQEIRIELVERLRGEQRFAGIDELRAQIARDIDRAVEILK